MTRSFSVVMPVHDKRDHLERAVDSVLRQSHPHFELLLVDDASTDGSAELARTFDDPRITLLERSVPGPGGYAARNLAIRAARHDWICFLDADDSWHPDFLAAVAAIRAAHPDADLVATGWRFRDDDQPDDWAPLPTGVDRRARPLHLVDYAGDQSLLCVINTTVRTSVVRGVGGFPEHPDRRRGADIDTLVRCLAAAGEAWRVDDDLASYFQGTANQVTDGRVAPPPSVPAATSLSRLRTETDDPAVRAALRSFQDRLVYTRLANRARAGRPVHRPLLRSLSWSPYGASRRVKVLALRARAVASGGPGRPEPIASTAVDDRSRRSIATLTMGPDDGPDERDQHVRSLDADWILLRTGPTADDVPADIGRVLDELGQRTALVLTTGPDPGRGPWLVRRDTFLQLGGLPTALDHDVATAELALRFLDAGYEVERLLDPPPPAVADGRTDVASDVARAVTVGARCVPVRHLAAWTVRWVRAATSTAGAERAGRDVAAGLARGLRAAIADRRRRRPVRAAAVRTAVAAGLVGAATRPPGGGAVGSPSPR